jgi:hypothetical protein
LLRVIAVTTFPLNTIIPEQAVKDLESVPNLRIKTFIFYKFTLNITDNSITVFPTGSALLGPIQDKFRNSVCASNYSLVSVIFITLQYDYKDIYKFALMVHFLKKFLVVVHIE